MFASNNRWYYHTNIKALCNIKGFAIVLALELNMVIDDNFF